MNYSSVLIIDQTLKEEVGKQTNAAFVLGLTAGRLLSDSTFGHEVIDGDGSKHAFLTNLPHFIKKATQSKMRSLRAEFMEVEGVIVVDYTEAAAPSTYADYARVLGEQEGEEISYRALYVYGPEEIVGAKTKNLSRL